MEDWRLTKRQNQIMRLMVDEMDIRQMAKSLNISDDTIRSHLIGIYSRYELEGDFKNSKALARYLKNVGKLEE